MTGSRILALVLVVVLSGGLWAASMDDILDAHDPSQEAGSVPSPTVTPAAPSTPAAVSPPPAAGRTADAPPQEIFDLIDKILDLIGDITKALEQIAATNADGEDTQKPRNTRTYTVQPGDCLWTIAQRFLGDGSQYWKLVEANKDRYPSLAKNPDLIYPGWQLKIPGAGEVVSDGGSQQTPATPGETPDSPPAGPPGSLQQRVVAEAQKLVGMRNFPYAPETDGGRLGCAQVVSTALKNAGVLSRISLGVRVVVNDLHARGWRDVTAPPFQAGDVICWRTYDFDGDGRDDPDTHIGIAMASGNSVQAMSNSSSQRMPRLHSATYMPVTRVLRKV